MLGMWQGLVLYECRLLQPALVVDSNGIIRLANLDVLRRCTSFLPMFRAVLYGTGRPATGACYCFRRDDQACPSIRDLVLLYDGICFLWNGRLALVDGTDGMVWLVDQ